MKSILLRNFLIIVFILQSDGISLSQIPVIQYNNRLSVSFYKNRRDALRHIMPPNSVFVLFASSERTFSADVDYVYHQNPDMFYFSGYTEPNSMMYIFKDEQKLEGIETPFNEIIFTPQEESAEVKYKNFPVDLLKFKMIILDMIPSDVRDNNSPTGLSSIINTFMEKAGIINKPDRLSVTLSNYITGLKNDSQQKEFIQQVKAYVSAQPNKVHFDPILSRYFDSTDSLTRVEIQDSLLNTRINYLYFNRFTVALRQIKTDEEIGAIRKAIDITCDGQKEVMKAITPEMSEREIQGIHEFMYKAEGAKDIGFAPIIASGNNGCTLHYQDNDVPRVGNTLVLMDVGAMFSGYSADVTRTIPANGKFSTEQLAIYNIVLEAQDSAFSYCKPGTPYSELNLIGTKVISEGLTKLGIIDSLEQVSKYYPHTISHSIGLDVHDKFFYSEPLANGMIITLEPGIYIPIGSKCDRKWWGIAVRIEDDILINNNTPVNLSLSAPRKAKDIEGLMKKSSPFNKFR